MRNRAGTTRLAILGAVGAACLTLALGGCGGPRDAAQQPQGSRQTVEDERALRAEVAIDRVDLTTAQRLTLTIDTQLRDGYELGPVDVDGALPENWRITEDRTTPLGDTDGWRRRQRAVVIEPFLDGEFSIGALAISASSRDGAEQVELHTEPMAVTVRSVLDAGAESSLADVKTVVEPPAPDRTWLWTGVGISAAALLAGALWLVLRKREPVVPEPRRRPAHEIALERLDALRRAGLLEHNAFKEFFAQTSLILRWYIEDRFGLHAPNQTTEEFLTLARVSLSIPRDDVAGLESFLRACDEIKFAAGVATRAQAEKAADSVREFIERTRSAETLVVVDEYDQRSREVAA